MRYLKSFKIFENKKESIKRPIFQIFTQLPHTVPLEIVYFVDNNWKGYFYKSPYGASFYSGKVDWGYKEDGSYRISDHWNFKAHSTGDKIHCPTKDPVENNSHWTLAQYDGNSKMYKVIMSLPKLETTEEFEISKKEKWKLKDKYLDLYKKQKEQGKWDHINPNNNDGNIDSGEYKKLLIKCFSTIKKITPDIEFILNGEKVDLLSWGPRQIKVNKNGEELSFSNKEFQKIEYKGYYNGELVIWSNFNKKNSQFDKSKLLKISEEI